MGSVVKLALALSVLSSSIACAADADAARKYGLLGRYALRCDEASGAQNPHVTYVVSQTGKVTRTLKMRPDLDGTFAISEVRSIGPESIQYSEQGRYGRLTTSVRLQGDTLRSWHSVTEEGKIYIEDGKFKSSGLDTPTFQRCGR